MTRPNFLRDDRGTVTVEASLAMITLLFFLLMSPALWKIWANEGLVRAEAAQQTMRLTSTFIDLNQYQVMMDTLMSDPTALLSGQSAEAADIPDLDPPSGCEGVSDLPNKVVIGTAKREVKYSDGGLVGFKGKLDIKRAAYTLRPTWTWQGYPFVHSQDMNERSDIVDWYTEAYEETLDEDTTDALALERDPL